MIAKGDEARLTVVDRIVEVVQVESPFRSLPAHDRELLLRFREEGVQTGFDRGERLANERLRKRAHSPSGPYEGCR